MEKKLDSNKEVLSEAYNILKQDKVKFNLVFITDENAGSVGNIASEDAAVLMIKIIKSLNEDFDFEEILKLIGAKKEKEIIYMAKGGEA